jgi:hypothetical protein
MANRKQRVILIVLSILLSLVVVNPALYALIWHVQHGNRDAVASYSSGGGYYGCPDWVTCQRAGISTVLSLVIDLCFLSLTN